MRLAAQTILTKRLNEQELKVECSAGSLVVNWQGDLNEFQNHRRAMMELASRLGWFENYAHGHLGDSTHVFVMLLHNNVLTVKKESDYVQNQT